MACMFPFMVSNPNYWLNGDQPAKIPVPCGKCPDCLQRRAAEWCFRIEQQDKVSDTSCFITLTYNTDYVPISPKGFMSLDKVAFPVFIRALRKLLPRPSKLKYYAVGEYGSLRRRPHYHAILFNLPDIVWSQDMDGNDIGYSGLADACWKFGVIDIRRCNPDTIGYTCKYLHKGKTVPAHPNDDRVKEFSLMSKGLGANYLSKDVIRYHSQRPDAVYVVSNGYKKAMPRYYRQRVFVCPVVRLAQSLMVQDRVLPAELKSKQEFIARRGSLIGYTASQAKARKQAVINFKVRAASKRKDL